MRKMYLKNFNDGKLMIKSMCIYYVCIGKRKTSYLIKTKCRHSFEVLLSLILV